MGAKALHAISVIVKVIMDCHRFNETESFQTREQIQKAVEAGVNALNLVCAGSLRIAANLDRDHDNGFRYTDISIYFSGYISLSLKIILPK